MANSNFIVQNGLTVGPTTIFAGNGDIITSGNLTSAQASASFYSINNTPIGNSAPSTGAFTTVSASAVYAATIGNSGATLTGTVSTASQPNITSVGTLSGLAVSGTTNAGTLIASTVNAATIGNTGATLIGSNVSILNTLTSTGSTSNFGQLNVGGAINYGPDYGLVGSFVANIPNYAYVAVQNLNTGGNASASFTAYNNTGTSYLDMGVNSSNFNATASGFVNNSLNTANAGYAYSYGGDLVVGTWNNNGIHFITNAIQTAGDSMFIAGNGNVYISGNLTVSGNTAFTYTTTNFVAESANVIQTAYLSGNASTNSGTITLTNNLIPNGTGVTLGSSGSPFGSIYGTLQTAAQPNITTLGGVTSIGASGSTTLTGTLQTASQTNITAVGTLAGLTVSAAIVPNANTSVNLGSTSVWWNNIYGVTFVGTSTSAKYADLAENYRGDKFYNPGTVLMFGGANEVTLADADTTRVAGVVSTNPAHLMNGGLNGANVAAVALMGRVPCNVIGPIAKGDLLVSAGFGFAKTNNGASVGQVIGKALEDFPILAKGVIEVVVGRV